MLPGLGFALHGKPWHEEQEKLGWSEVQDLTGPAYSRARFAREKPARVSARDDNQAERRFGAAATEWLSVTGGCSPVTQLGCAEAGDVA